MTNKKISILFLLIVLICFSTNAQKKSPQLSQTKYAYTFSGEASTSTLENLTLEISNLKGVTSCKPVYKDERSSGQLIIFVEEYSRTSEGEILFEPSDLKKIILKNGLVPGELSTEQLDR